MRNAFASEIMEIASSQPEVVLLSGDIGNRLFDKFKLEHGERFQNCGVAEANMIGVAAGLALAGFRPVCYTIANFLTYRCMEQIRVDLCYHHLPVVLVGTGSGLAYASLGATHHTCEETGMLRLLPGLTVLAPCDSMELRSALRDALQHEGPVYIRIGKKGEPVLHKEVPAGPLGSSHFLREGVGICLLASGTITHHALAAANILSQRGVSPAVASCPGVKPLDEEFLAGVFENFSKIICLEEHARDGGFGTAVLEWMNDQRMDTSRLLRLGTRDEFLHENFEQEEALEFFGLTAGKIADQIEHHASR